MPRVTLNVGGVAADENYTMCGPSFHVSVLFDSMSAFKEAFRKVSTQPNFYMMWPSATLSKSDPSTIPTEEVII